MTANPFAALLAGVSHYYANGQDDSEGYLLDEAEVLAALAAAVPDDLAEAESVAVDLCRTGELSMPYRCDIAEIIRELIARIAAQEAQIKGLEVQRDAIAQKFDELHPDPALMARIILKSIDRECAAEAAETALAAERAKTAKLVEAGKALGGWCANNVQPNLHMDRHLQALDAAITEASQ